MGFQSIYLCGKLHSSLLAEALSLYQSTVAAATSIEFIQYLLENIEREKRHRHSMAHAYLVQEMTGWKWILENDATSPTNE